MTYESYNAICLSMTNVLRWYIIRIPRFSCCYCRSCWSRKEWRESAILALNARKESAVLLVRPPVSLFTAVLNKREVMGQRGVKKVREECRSGTALIELPSVFTSRGFLYLYFRLLPGHTGAAASCNFRLSRRDERKKT